MTAMFFYAITFFALVIPSQGVEQGYVQVPCAVSQAGKITVRKECGVLPVFSIDGAQPVPNPYIGTE